MTEGTVIVFFGGVVATLAGVITTSLLQRRGEKLRRKERMRFEVYMRLLDVNSLYFRVTSAEATGEAADPQVWERLHSASWQIADKLRDMDEVEFLDEILDVLLADKYSTASERARALEQVIDQLGHLVNPRYANAIRRVSDTNQKRMLQGPRHISNAPGRTWP